MDVRFYNAGILTLDGGFSINNGELWVSGNRIAYIGNGKDAGHIKWNREINCEGNLIMPGFKNAHTHSAMTFLRSLADDLPLMDWLNQKVFPMEAKLQDEDVMPLVTLAVMEYLTSGITTAFDMYFYNHVILRNIANLGFRMVFCGSVNDFCGSVESLEEEYRYANQVGELVGYRLGFHAEYTTNVTLLERIAALGSRLKAPVYMHNSETVSEVEGCKERHGLTPTALFERLGVFEYGGGGFHCVHVSGEDMEILKKRGVSVITNPSSNAKLASGIPPLTEMMDRGINLAIGTDGPASNNCLDVFREMFLTTALQKLRTGDASAMEAEKVLYMATVGGAKAMGLTDCDVLREGKLADLVLIDMHQPNMQPVHNVVSNLVYSGSKRNVKLTMVNGRILYEDGTFHIGEEPEEVYRKVNEITRRMTGKDRG